MKHAKLCVPFIFFAMHQQTDQKSSEQNEAKSLDSSLTVWTDVWEEATSGITFLREIIFFFA